MTTSLPLATQRRVGTLNVEDIGKTITFVFNGVRKQGTLARIHPAGASWLRLIALGGVDGEYPLYDSTVVTITEPAPEDRVRKGDLPTQGPGRQHALINGVHVTLGEPRPTVDDLGPIRLGPPEPEYGRAVREVVPNGSLWEAAEPFVDVELGPVEVTDRLMTIEHRIDQCESYNFGMVSADRLAHEDARWMLGEIRRLRTLAGDALGVNS